MDKDKILIWENIDNMLDKVKKQYKKLQDRNEELLKQIKEFDKDTEISKLREKNNWLYKNSLVVLTDKESKDLNNFLVKHSDHNKGSTYEYKITHTGIGHCIVVKCPICGEEKDITDVDNW